MPTKIEWCDESWNPVRTAGGGWWCRKESAECDHCFAERFNLRFGDKKPFDGRDVALAVNERALHQLFSWRKSRRIFVMDMGDIGLLYETHRGYFRRVVSTISQSLGDKRGHTFIFLTKRPASLYEGLREWWPTLCEIGERLEIGVTAGTQKAADLRIPELLKFRNIAPDAKLFVSAEPMLELIKFTKWLAPRSNSSYPDSLDGVILGGETGQGARAMNPQWPRIVRDDCSANSTPFFFKGWGRHVPSPSDCAEDESRLLDGREWNELPGQIGR